MNAFNMNRISLVKTYLWVCSIFLAFWWPLSHWFYSDFYHQTIMGFAPGSYPEGMVKTIGVCGVIPVLLAYFAARDPLNNRPAVISLITFSFLIAFTYISLILEEQFPVNEMINVVICLFSAIFLLVFFPWQQSKPKTMKAAN